jgi:putative tryptophan/tyrosine transport system substrate-binding protein
VRRRGFISAIGVTLAVPSVRAWAQSTSRIYRVAVLSNGAFLDESSPLGKALTNGLASTGFSLGRNFAFESRAAYGHAERLSGLVAELVASKVDVIVTTGFPAALAAKRGTTLPIVSINSGDPVSTGLVASLAHPGGNITGISDVSAEVSPKRLELLREFAPNLHKVAVLWNADDLGMTQRYRALESVAKPLGVTLQPLGVREPEDFALAFKTMDGDRPDGILMVTDALTNLNRKRVFDYAAAHKLPAIYEFEVPARDGGLMSYGPDSDESNDRVAALVGRILKGAKPADLPFEQPTKFLFVINLKTARLGGFEVPPVLLNRADEVVE